MKRWVAVFMALALAGGCARGASDDSIPTVAITALSASGRSALLAYDVGDDDDEPLTIDINWGDDPVGDQVTGIGPLEATHEYDDDVTDPVVTIVVADADGNTNRIARTLTLTAATTTSTSSTSTSSTTSPSSTSTTVAATTTTSSTTTTVAPTTTTSTTTTTVAPTTTTSTSTTTTTTLAPDEIEDVFRLSFDDADVNTFTEPGSHDADASRTGRSGVQLYASATGIGGGSAAHLTAEWRLPHDEFAKLGDAPGVGVFLRSELTGELDTAETDGNSATLDMTLEGYIDGERFGSGSNNEFVDAGEDTAEFDRSTRDLGFGAPIERGDHDIVVVLRVSCFASGAGALVGALGQSVCDFRDSGGKITFDDLRITVTRAT